MTAPKIDTQKPEQLGTSRELVERIARVIEHGDLFAPAMRKPVGAVIRSLLFERDKLRKLDAEYGRVESAIIMADRDFDGDSDHANCGDRLIASVHRLRDRADLSAAREAAAALEMRDRLARLEHTAAKYGYDEIADAVKAVADDLATADASAALDRLIAEARREAFDEAAQIVDCYDDDDAAYVIRARASKEVQS